MSLISPTEATQVFEALPQTLRIPGLAPAYVLADAGRDSGSDPVFFVHRAKGEVWYHPTLRRSVPRTNLCDLESPYGYGGPVATTEDPLFLTSAEAAWKEWCDEEGVLAEFIRFHPLLENWRFSQAEAAPNRATVWIDLTQQDIGAGFLPRARTAMRKAEKEGVTVYLGNDAHDLQTFSRLYADNMARIGAARNFFFPWDYFLKLHAMPGTRLYLAERGGRCVAGAMFLAEGEYLEYHLSASDVEGRRISAVTRLIRHAADAAKAQGLLRMHLGGGNDETPNNPLFFFKTSFSPYRASFRVGRRVHRPADYAALVQDWTMRNGVSPARLLFYHDHSEPERLT